ncbi:MAG TPA: nucleotidyltransferase family protein [Bacteroidales bacterium]|nr:nucleotidyltransferase family protein [Bacteroidales bacterium]
MNSSVNTTVFNILLQSIRLNDVQDAVSKAESIISENIINWDDLYSASGQHSIRPQLAKLITSVDPSLIPNEFRQKLDLAHHEILYRQMSFVSEFLKIRQLLHSAGIMAVPFKGFWIASEFYGNLADRESIDIDLFVRDSDLGQIAAIMINEGYKPQNDFLKYSIDEIKKYFHEYNFDRFEGNERLFHVEFHWRMSTENYGMDITFEDLSSEIAPGKLQDHEIDVFSPSANLLLTVMHHGGRDLFSELKQVLDIAMIMKNDPGLDWKMILHQADRFKVRNLVLVAVSLASDLSGVQIPEEIEVIVSSEKITKLVENRKRFLEQISEMKSGLVLGLNRWWFRMRALTSLRIKMKLTWLIMVLLFTSFLVPGKLRKYFPYSELSSRSSL